MQVSSNRRMRSVLKPGCANYPVAGRSVRRHMKFVPIFLMIFVFAGNAGAQDHDKLIVTFASDDTQQFQVFSISRSEVKNLPAWNPGEEEPPLSVEEAIRAGEKSLGDSIDSLRLENIRLAGKSSSGINDVWFYHLFYANLPADLSDPLRGRNVVVLMDGRILKAEIMAVQDFEKLLMQQ